MKVGCLCLVLCALLLCCVCSDLQGAEVLKGCLVSVSDNGRSITIESGGKTTVLTPVTDAKVMRGQVGKDLRNIRLADMAPGDHIVAVAEPTGQASSVKAFFGLVQGTCAEAPAGKLVIKDGKTVKLNPKVEISLPGGKIGSRSDLKPGTFIICRTNPITDEAWTVIVAAPVDPQPPVATQPAPRITAVTYSAPTPLRPGDKLTVNLVGTPGGTASFKVEGITAGASMTETSPGFYKASIDIRKGTSVRNAPLVGRLKVNGSAASPVQARELVTVVDTVVTAAQDTTPAAQVTPTKPTSIPDGETQPPATTVQQKTTAGIVITSPADGSQIPLAILIKGNAEPDAKVQVTTTFNNGQVGLLKLSGQVASQTLSAGKNGQFVMGPIPLEGPLATRGLRFTIKAYYPDRQDHGTAIVTVVGNRR